MAGDGFRGYIGIMEKKMETTIGFRVSIIVITKDN